MNATEDETDRRPRKTELIQARVDPDTRKLLRKASLKTDSPESDIVRRALRLYLQSEPQLAS